MNPLAHINPEDDHLLGDYIKLNKKEFLEKDVMLCECSDGFHIQVINHPSHFKCIVDGEFIIVRQSTLDFIYNAIEKERIREERRKVKQYYIPKPAPQPKPKDPVKDNPIYKLLKR